MNNLPICFSLITKVFIYFTGFVLSANLESELQHINENEKQTKNKEDWINGHNQ